jgi:hypothetical protein
MAWTVHLGGETSDLDKFVTFAATALRLDYGWVIVKKHKEYLVYNVEFENLNDAIKILARAAEILDLWNGIARLSFDCGRIRAKQARRVLPDGRQQATWAVQLHVRPAPAPNAREASERYFRAAKDDPAVRAVVRLLQKGLSDWVNLYRIYEVIKEACGGIDKIASLGWASKTEMRLFQHTANSPNAIGDEARHGIPTGQPPASPMALNEARTLIRGITENWLKMKTSVPGS